MKKIIEIIKKNTLAQLAIVANVLLVSSLFASHNDVAHLIMTFSCGILGVYALAFLAKAIMNVLK